MANFGIFTQECLLTLQFGNIFGDIPLVVNSSTWLGLGVPSPDGRFWQLSKALPSGGHLGTGKTRNAAPSIAVLACLLQAWADSAGLQQAGQWARDGATMHV